MDVELDICKGETDGKTINIYNPKRAKMEEQNTEGDSTQKSLSLAQCPDLSHFLDLEIIVLEMADLASVQQA